MTTVTVSDDKPRRIIAIAAGDAFLHLTSRDDSDYTRCGKPVMYIIKQVGNRGRTWCDKCVPGAVQK